MTGIFRNNTPANNFLLLVYAVLLKLPMFIHPCIPVFKQEDGFLFGLLLNYLNPLGRFIPWIFSLISFCLLVSQAFLLNNVVNNQKLYNKPNFLTAMSFLLITSIFQEWQHLSPSLLINTMMIVVFTQLCKLHNHQQPKSILFNIGLLVGLSAFLYYPSLFLLLLVFVGLGITRPFRIREWLTVVIGILTPFYFAAAIFYLTGKWQILFARVKISAPFIRESKFDYAAMIIIGISVLAGTFFMQSNLRRQLVQTRKSWGLVYLYLLVSFAIPFINSSPSFGYWMLSAVPVSVIMAAALLYPERKWFPIFIHWSLVALVIYIGYFLT